MLTLNVISSETVTQISGTINGTPFNVDYSEELLNKLKDFQKEFNELVKADGSADDYYALVYEVEEFINSLDEDDVITSVCTDLYLNKTKGTYHVKAEGRVSDKAVPQPLVDMILESIDKGISPDPVIKAWVRFLRNPNFTVRKGELFAKYITAKIVDVEYVSELVENGYSEERATALATYSDVSISQEGIIVGKKYASLLTEGWEMDTENNVPVRVPLYKKSPVVVDKISGKVSGGEDILPDYNEDLYFEPAIMGTSGDEFSCGEYVGHVIRVGQMHTLEKWSMVNTDDDSCCVKGLHVGGWNYVNTYAAPNRALLDCFIDPADIGAIISVDDGGDGALRVKSYFIYDYNKGRNRGMYHSSHFAKIKDEEWEAYKLEAIAASNDVAQDLMESAENLGI